MRVYAPLTLSGFQRYDLHTRDAEEVARVPRSPPCSVPGCPELTAKGQPVVRAVRSRGERGGPLPVVPR